MLHLANLSSSEVFSGDLPWGFVSLGSVPVPAFEDKGARDRWINTPTTSFSVYTLYEGTQKNLRLRGARAGGDDNPPLLMHGLAIDYDCPMTVRDVENGLHALGEMLPNFFEQTLSGNGRLVWLFEKPLLLPNRRFLVKLLETLDQILPFRKYAGLDEAAYKAPERYFTNGCRWTMISRRRVPDATLRGFVMKVSEKFDWTNKEFGKAVNLEAIEEECKKRFPRFADWEGEFVLGAAGPSFWIDGSTSPKSAIIRETGMHTFSAHATKAFYSWAELVGQEFVENDENARLGKAVEGIYHDGQTFIIADGFGKYATQNKENLKLLLQTFRGLRNVKNRDGSPTEVERAIASVLHNQRIYGASSCAFYPKGIFEYNGNRILNTHQIDALPSAPEPTVWGAEGKFPWLSRFFDSFFDPDLVQRDRFFAWWKRYYLMCLNRSPLSGQAVFMCGPADSGKTFLNRQLVGHSVGGFVDVTPMMMGNDNFNSECFEKVHWCIDDAAVAADERRLLLYAENSKRFVANPDHRANEKFRKAVMVPWQGRQFTTMNLDHNSLRLIVNTDLSNLDKIMIFRVRKSIAEFVSQPEMRALRDAELPHFLRWLVDWAAPAHCYEGASPRFGVAPYSEASILRSVNLSSSKLAFNELLTLFLKDFFGRVSPSAEYWEGSATKLRLEMSADQLFVEPLRSYRNEVFPKMLMTMRDRREFKIEITDTDMGRTFRIYRDSRFVAAKVGAPDLPKVNSVSFQKAP